MNASSARPAPWILVLPALLAGAILSGCGDPAPRTVDREAPHLGLEGPASPPVPTVGPDDAVDRPVEPVAPLEPAVAGSAAKAAPAPRRSP